jgi:hypothetical protein
MRRLGLQPPQRQELALPFDDPLDTLHPKGADQLVLQVGNADVKAETLETIPVQIVAEACSLEGPSEVWFFALVAQAAEHDVRSLASNVTDEAADGVRSVDGRDLDTPLIQVQPAALRERLEGDLVALPFDDDDRTYGWAA